MGYASYLEDDWEAFLERAVAPPCGPRGPVRHHCPFCPESFEHRTFLSDHLVSVHYGHRPILMMAGREPPREWTMRQTLSLVDIVFENCSEVHARVNGRLRKETSAEAAQTLLSHERSAEIELELVNRANTVGIPIRQSYRISARIPDKRLLDAVDRAFIEHLRTETANMAQVAAFLDDPRCQGVTSDYADALGSYVRGVLVRDQSVEAGVTLPSAEADQLYGAALDALKVFSRPLTLVVCGVIRFAFNDFGHINVSSGFRRLDRCNSLLSRLLRLETAAADNWAGAGTGQVVNLCPLDHGIDQVLYLSERLTRQERWGPTLLEECRYASHTPTLPARDRCKILVLWASSALRLGARDAADEPLRELRATYPFGTWAGLQLDHGVGAGR